MAYADEKFKSMVCSGDANTGLILFMVNSKHHVGCIWQAKQPDGSWKWVGMGEPVRNAPQWYDLGNPTGTSVPKQLAPLTTLHGETFLFWLDAATGDIYWKKPREFGSSWHQVLFDKEATPTGFNQIAVGSDGDQNWLFGIRHDTGIAGGFRFEYLRKDKALPFYYLPIGPPFDPILPLQQVHACTKPKKTPEGEESAQLTLFALDSAGSIYYTQDLPRNDEHRVPWQKLPRAGFVRLTTCTPNDSVLVTALRIEGSRPEVATFSIPPTSNDWVALRGQGLVPQATPPQVLLAGVCSSGPSGHFVIDGDRWGSWILQGNSSGPASSYSPGNDSTRWRALAHQPLLGYAIGNLAPKGELTFFTVGKERNQQPRQASEAAQPTPPPS